MGIWCKGCQRGQTPDTAGKCPDCGQKLEEPAPVIAPSEVTQSLPDSQSIQETSYDESGESVPQQPKAKKVKVKKKKVSKGSK